MGPIKNKRRRQSATASSIRYIVTRRYVFAIVLIGLLSASTLSVFGFVVTGEEARSAAVNLAGRQRMLSQRILWAADLITLGRDASIREKARTVLKGAVEEFKTSHRLLSQGRLPDGKNIAISPETKAILYAAPHLLDRQVKAFIAAAEQTLIETETGDRPVFGDAGAYLTGAGPEALLFSLESFVRQLQVEGEASIAFLHRLELAIFIATIIVLLLEARFIFSPLARRIENQFEELQTAKVEAESGNRTKSFFLATMSHELRTPLNAIVGFADTLQNNIFGAMANERQREYVEGIHTSGQHLLGLVDDLLDLSSLEAGELPLNVEFFDLRTQCERVVNLMKHEADVRGITIISDYGRQACPVELDKQRCMQIMINLLGNAIKYSHDGGAILFIVRPDPDDPKQVLFRISDNGVGIRSEDLPNVLRPYMRVRDPEITDTDGTGLGLPITKSLVAAFGGNLDIESRTNVGTTVTVTLPGATDTTVSAREKRLHAAE